ncbi:MAG: Phosphoglycerate kinase [Candidatus Jorgensenbacteria bacterium GW2011_GWC1_48_8]|uniref:Phosphoglycerate kinase n=1 Tax=Candidatus Jorgensenbacteria bacterium GW2011_GWC1_48_8 TaxID=1618666 RepID=A0A0G1X7N9_9BACT|nr:MAG: Phosphoglycerate kinase [Candidatus Jorgensenbacteria bacterium GW2011_GWC1_48_8]
MSVFYLSKTDLKKMRGKTALVRVDLNIEPGAEKNSFRLEAILPTIRFLLARGAKVVILSHRGRPRGRDKNLSLRPFAPILQKELKQRVEFMTVLPRMIAPQRGKVFLLGNLRFWKGEEKNDVGFARRLAALGDFYMNDAFAVPHRKNASVVAITRFLPSYAGLLLEKEIKNLGGILKYTTHPFTIILGGGKTSDKLGVMNYFWNKADNLLLGGAPANTVFVAQKLPVGNSLIDRGSTSQILKLIRKEVEPRKIVLPLDVKIADKKILDIGPQTVEKYSKIISKSRTVIWNGPPGLFEKKGFEKGTIGIWRAILRNRKAKIIVGGGETTASFSLIHNSKFMIPKNIFLSTGGGAMLKFLSGRKLPGIEALK